MQRRKQGPCRLQLAVGKGTYQTWISMLRDLVPQGRTHRLSVVTAAMLRYTVHHANKKGGGPVRKILSEADNEGEYSKAADDAVRVVQRLFKDAGVKWNRVSAKGEKYSVAKAAVEEFIGWYRYPWEDSDSDRDEDDD